MKKLISLVLVALLALSSTSVSMAESTTFDAKLTSAMGYENTKWSATATNRAYLSVLLSLDLYLTDSELGEKALTACTNGMSYVGVDSSSDVVSVFYGYEKSILIVLFDASDNTAAYNISELTIDNDLTESAMGTFMDSLVSRGTLASTYHNEVTDINTAVSTISAALKSTDD